MYCITWPCILQTEHYWCNNIIKFMMDDEICESMSSVGCSLAVDDVWWFHCVVSVFIFIVFIFFPLVHGSSLSLVSSTSSIYSTVSIMKWKFGFTNQNHWIDWSYGANYFCHSRRKEKKQISFDCVWMLARKGMLMFKKMAVDI